jgi:hypothetical protein
MRTVVLSYSFTEAVILREAKGLSFDIPLN